MDWAKHEKLQQELAAVKRENEFLKAVSAYLVSSIGRRNTRAPEIRHSM